MRSNLHYDFPPDTITVTGGMNMKLNYIREFVTLAETLNFSKAAEKLFLAQPALSRHIAIIEEIMGSRLFERTTRNVSLTPAGEVVYNAFTEILRQYDDAREQVSLLSSGQSGVLSISSPYYWTSDYTEPVVEHFNEEFPLCAVKIYSCQPAEGFDNLLTKKTDLMMTLSIPKFKSQISDDIRVFEFARETLLAMMSSDHPLAGQEAIKPEQLNGEALVFMEEEIYSTLNETAEELLAKHGAQPCARIYSQQVDTLAYTVRKTGGVAVIPYGVRHMDRDYISFVPIEGDDFVLPMSFYYRYDNENPLIPQFLRCAAEVFACK